MFDLSVTMLHTLFQHSNHGHHRMHVGKRIGDPGIIVLRKKAISGALLLCFSLNPLCSLLPCHHLHEPSPKPRA